jgi:hypothetical protein
MSEEDLFYLEDKELVRQLIEVGYHGKGELDSFINSNIPLHNPNHDARWDFDQRTIRQEKGSYCWNEEKQER